MDPFQRSMQITIPSSAPVKRMGVEMIEMTALRLQRFLSRKVNKQAFYNMLIAGIYELETKGDLDFKEVEKKGLLATITDRGASYVAKLDAMPEDEDWVPRGARVAIEGIMEEEEDDEAEAPAPPQKQKRPPGLLIPLGFARPSKHGGGDRTEEVDQSSVRRHPIP